MSEQKYAVQFFLHDTWAFIHESVDDVKGFLDRGCDIPLSFSESFARLYNRDELDVVADELSKHGHSWTMRPVESREESVEQPAKSEESVEEVDRPPMIYFKREYADGDRRTREQVTRTKDELCAVFKRAISGKVGPGDVDVRGIFDILTSRVISKTVQSRMPDQPGSVYLHTSLYGVPVVFGLFYCHAGTRAVVRPADADAAGVHLQHALLLAAADGLYRVELESDLQEMFQLELRYCELDYATTLLADRLKFNFKPGCIAK